MPTPSSNGTPNPSAPVPHGFTTCPDDTQSRPDSDMETEDESSLAQSAGADHRVATRPLVSSVLPVHQEGLSDIGLDNLGITRRTTAVTSRATTASPQPQSSLTSGITPDSIISDTEANKNLGSLSASQSSLPHQAPTSDTRASHDLYNGRRSPDQDDNGVFRESSTDAAVDNDLYAPSMGSDFSSMRTKPLSPCSFLRPGSKFHGTQQSEKQVYDVQVDIKNVDLRESFLCGYLRIQGLTEDHPTLTTYFEGEIIGPKYGFLTKHDDWGASHTVDINHWRKFSAFRPFLKQVRRGPVTVSDSFQRENIFMRWKEHFLVPDHRVRTISGASFEGFYYICFNQVKGEVSGIYFHSKSEKFQQLELKHVPDRGCFSAVEFR